MTANSATAKFVSQLRLHGVELWSENGRLRYSAPKNVLNEDVLEELKNRKEQIIVLLEIEKNRSVSVSGSERIKPITRGRFLPLSFAQQRIWFLDELEPENPFYNVALAKKINGQINTEALRQSLFKLIERHEVLRSICVNTGQGPMLKIIDADKIDTNGDWFSVEQLEESINEDALLKKVNAEIKPALPLSNFPLIRARLLQLNQNEAVLTFTTHHFVVDGWSCGILMRELSAFYNSIIQEKKVDLPKLEIQYPDFAAWQNQLLQSSELENQKKYWKKTLENLSTLNLPTDKVRPPIQTYKGDIYHFSLPKDLAPKLKEISRKEGVTLYMTLLAAFQVLLYRYSQQDEIILGTAVSNRHSSELETLLGPFVNTLVIRGNLSENPEFKTVISRARDTAAGAFSNQDLPFELLVEELKPERDRSRSPLFQVLFVVHQYTGEEELNLNGTEIKDYPVAPGTTMYDLFLQLIEMNNAITGSIEFSTDLFTRDSIKRMTAHLITLLRGIAEDPNKRILDLPLMDQAESRKILRKWNQTSINFQGNYLLHELIEEQSKLSADNLAIVFNNKKLSYKQLNDRANQIGRFLLANGLEIGNFVGVYIDRSIDMVPSLFAIMKCGATYIPLDPSFPNDRIGFMIEDSGLEVLITTSNLVTSLKKKPKVIICLDEIEDKLKKLDRKNLNINIKKENLAYLIYTSGSTGKPKGVQIAHHSVTNFLKSIALKPGISSEDVLIAVTTLSFDIAVLELFLPLVNGAKLIIADTSITADGYKLAELIEDSNATIMQATPATWQLLLEAGWKAKNKIRALCGGEALPRDLANRLLNLKLELWNMYGPTETTIWSSVAKVLPTGPIDIGYPIANTQMFIIDKQNKPVPIGIPGELCISGHGVSCGYLNRPELNKKSFVANPFLDNDYALYRTGDLARYLPDGRIECLGRNDNQ
ncbi:MAG: amino acid adenylation domain-containing protein, partial [Pseudomonadota bacterium]|nr:amino acid adenylation domain-containing protein [Pseudomonadota bacterium]